MDALTFSRELIRRASTTPADAGCQDLMIEQLERLGFGGHAIAVRRRNELLGASRQRGAAARLCRSHRCGSARTARAMDIAAIRSRGARRASVRTRRCRYENRARCDAGGDRTFCRVDARPQRFHRGVDHQRRRRRRHQRHGQSHRISGARRRPHRLLHRRRTIVRAPHRRSSARRPARIAERTRAHSRCPRSCGVSGPDP